MKMNKQNLDDLIGGYGEMVQHIWDIGWRPFLLSLKFDTIPGGSNRRKSIMLGEIEQMYHELLCHVFKRPRRVPADFLPLMFVMPDHPVFKRNHDMLRNIAINDGLHYHAILLMPPWSRMKIPLDEYFEKRMEGRQNTAMLLPHVEPITHDAAYVTDYAVKGLKSCRNSWDDLIVFPRSAGELWSRREHRAQARDYREERKHSGSATG